MQESILPQHPDLASLRANNPAGWSAAYPFLWNAALSVIAGRLKGGAADQENIASDLLCHEVIPGVIEGRAAFAGLRDFEELLKLVRVIAVRRSIDEIRKWVRKKEVPLEEAPPDRWELSDGNAREPSWAEWMSLIERELEPPDPVLFEDRFLTGLTTREIALKRGMPHGTVVSRFARALKKLSALLPGRNESNVG